MRGGERSSARCRLGRLAAIDVATWDASRVERMERIVSAYLDQHPACMSFLVESVLPIQEADLVDGFWGAKGPQGVSALNNYGKLLERIREKKCNETKKRKAPPDEDED